MSRTRRSARPQRRRIFVGCEGVSERGYVTCVNDLLQQQHKGFHLDAEVLGGGDPLSLVKKAVRQIQNRNRTRELDKGRFIFLDSDKNESLREQTQQAKELAQSHSIVLVWLDPCFEAFLLRHLPGCERVKPATSQEAMTRLRQHWPDYNKGLPAMDLKKRINRAAVLRVAEFHEGLRTFLTTIKFDL